MSITRFATIGPHVLHYRLDGQCAAGTVTETPLVFINSLGSDLRIWDDLISNFAARFPPSAMTNGARVSPTVRQSLYFADHTTDLAGLLAGLQMQTAILIGISVSGMVVLLFSEISHA